MTEIYKRHLELEVRFLSRFIANLAENCSHDLRALVAVSSVKGIVARLEWA
jgi:hypothetical protein